MTKKKQVPQWTTQVEHQFNPPALVEETEAKTIIRNGLEVSIMARGNLYRFPTNDDWEVAEFFKMIERNAAA